VILTTGMNAPAYAHVTLAERLAGRGYLVVAAPTGGFAGRARLAFDSAGVASHVSDLRSVVAAVRRWPDVDSARVAIAAWSVGGVGAAVVAEEVGARALVSLDAATSYAYGVEYLTRLTPSTWRSRVPYLDLRGTVESQVPHSEGFAERRCGAPTVRAVVDGVAHRHFVSLWGSLSTEPPTAERAAMLAGVEAWEELVARFVEAAMDGGDFSALAAGGAGLATVSHSPAPPCPA
jgi:dienelactone hydrolase